MGTPPPLPEPVRGLRLEERAPSITTLIVEATKAVSSVSSGPVCASDLLTVVPGDVPGIQPARFAGFAADAHVVSRPHSSPFAVVAGEEEGSCVTEPSPLSVVNGSAADALSQCQQLSQPPESFRASVPTSPFETNRAPRLVSGHGSAFGTAAAQGAEAQANGVSRRKQHSESAGDFSSRQLAGQISSHHWSPSSLQSHWAHPDPSALVLPLSAPSPPAKLTSSGSRSALGDGVLTSSSAVEVLSPRLEHCLQSILPNVLHHLLPSLLPDAVAVALPAATAVLSTATTTASPSLEALLPAVLEATLPQALATALPKAVTCTLNALFKSSSSTASASSLRGVHSPATTAPAASASAPPSPPGAAAAAAATAALAVSGERQHSMSLEQQSAAEAQLVRMLFGTDVVEMPAQQQQRQTGNARTIMPGVFDIAAAIASGINSPGGSLASRAGSPTGSGTSSPTEQPLGSRPSSVKNAAVADAQDHGVFAAAEPATMVAAAAARRPSLAAFAGATGSAGASLSTAAGDTYCRRLSDTNHSSGAPMHTARPTQFLSGSHKVTGQGSAAANILGQAGQRQYCASSGGSGANLGHAEDGVSSADEALSTCSGGDMPSPYTEFCAVGGSSVLGSVAAANSGANSLLVAAGSGGDMTSSDGPTASGLYGVSGDALLDRLKQVQQSQQQQHNAAAAALSHMASPAELLMAAAGGASRSCAAGTSILAGQMAQQAQQSQSAVAAALFMQQQQRQQQEAEALAAQQQLQQLQALVAGRSLNEQDLVPPSPTPPTNVGVQWRRSSGTDVGFNASAADLWQAADADALGFAAAAQLALGQQQQQQQAMAAAGLLQQQQQQQQLIAQSMAAVAAANAAGRAVRPEEFLTFGTSAAGLQLPATTNAAGLGSQAAAVQLAAAAAAAVGGAAATTATDLASYMDAALRRMLLVSPQVAAELARACGAFSGAHAQLHHLCCVIAEQLLDVAAMAPEVAAALLRALAAHRARGAQATDVDPRVMGRILQLLRAGPAGRQLCLVSLEQWVDGLSRIHKRRAYLDTILHNYQLTLKRLVQAMGHQVHAVNMSLPRQLLNDLSPRALLLLTAELAPYPLLQPRRWSEEIIWNVTQLHAMGIDMPATAVAPAGAAQASAPTSAFQWEIRRALAATADDIAAAGGAAAACGQSPPSAGLAGPLGGLAGLNLGGSAACQAAAGSSGATTPGGTAVPWAAHAALHRHLLLGLRRVQSRFFSDRLRKMHGLYGEPVEALLRSSLPQDVLVPERESVVLVAVLLMIECRMRPEDFDAAVGRDLQRCLAVSSVEEVAARLRCGLVPDSPLRLEPQKSRALSQLLKLGSLPGQSQF